MNYYIFIKMKASELILELQKHIKLVGDLDVEFISEFTYGDSVQVETVFAEKAGAKIIELLNY